MNVNPFYEKFSNHPFIQSIAQNEKWTISTKDKMPIDMYELMYNKRIRGAQYSDNLSLTSLEKLNSVMPAAANYAYYLNAPVDGFVVLDIEPKCPKELRQKLMTMDALYVEKSMSGKGIHMVFKYPYDIIAKYPNAAEKIVFKEPENGSYEILINHYVTFTGNALEYEIDPNIEKMSFTELFEEMAAMQKSVQVNNVDFEELKPVETGQIERVFELLRYAADTWRKTPEDFTNQLGEVDNSKYEFAYIGYLYDKLNTITKVSAIAEDHTYTDEEKVWIIYSIAKDVIPYREKHDSYRNGQPWLVYLITSVMAKYEDRKDAK